MKLLYVIKDNVMDEVTTIFMANNDNHARMIFENSIKAAKKAGYDSEFDLIAIAGIDMITGEVSPCTPKVVNVLQQDFDFEEVDN